MEKKRAFKDNLLNSICFFVILFVVYYFIFPGETLWDVIELSLSTAILYYLFSLIDFSKLIKKFNRQSF